MTKPKKKSSPGDNPKPKRRKSSASGGAPTVVRLAENLTVNGIKLLYGELSQYLEGSETLSIDASGVQAIDTAGLQLLAAFTKEIGGQDRHVEWLAPSSEFVQIVELLDMKEELGNL